MSWTVARCSAEAAEWACRRWHYTGTVPNGRRVDHGYWEGDDFKGSVSYAHGANMNLATQYTRPFETCELVRVALARHERPVTQILSRSLQLLKATNPGLRLVVSYADTRQGHLGTIYQAGNWIYVGTIGDPHIVIHGQRHHGRSVSSRYGTRSLPWLRKHVDPEAHREDPLPKHKYLMPLDRKLGRDLRKLHQPYPKLNRG